jgi:hypothetical protein
MNRVAVIIISILSVAVIVFGVAAFQPAPAGSVGPAGATGAQGPAGAAGADGKTGSNGADGSDGSDGAASDSGGGGGTVGKTGATGAAGPKGVAGATGPAGAAGASGIAGPAGAPGLPGIQGPAGAQGNAGPIGPIGADGSGESALFYALNPPDNDATVAPGEDVTFPRDGPTTTSAIVRNNGSQFLVTKSGVYRVSFSVSVQEAGQLELTLNGDPLTYTVSGRATGTSSISITTLVAAPANSILTVQNPPVANSALTIPIFAGGSMPSASTLLIELVKAS